MTLKPWQTLLVGALAGMLAIWFLTPRPGPDLAPLHALQDSAKTARAQATRDSLRLAQVDDSLARYRDTVAAVTRRARKVESMAAKAAGDAEARVRAALDSAGRSTAGLDTLVAAHAQEIAAKDEELAARDRERAVLYQRIAVSDTLISSLRLEIQRKDAAAAEKDRIAASLKGQLRGAKIRERLAEGIAVLAIVKAMIG